MCITCMKLNLSGMRKSEPRPSKGTNLGVSVAFLLTPHDSDSLPQQPRETVSISSFTPRSSDHR